MSKNAAILDTSLNVGMTSVILPPEEAIKEK
jgi:hypothetical protein